MGRNRGAILLLTMTTTFGATPVSAEDAPQGARGPARGDEGVERVAALEGWSRLAGFGAGALMAAVLRDPAAPWILAEAEISEPDVEVEILPPKVSEEAGPEAKTFHISAVASLLAERRARLEQLRDEAREARDMIRLRCVKERLDQASKVEAEARAKADEALARAEEGDMAGLDQAVRVMDQAAATLDRLVEEAEKCAGTDDLEDSQTSIEVDGEGGGGGGEGGSGAGGVGGSSAAPAPGPSVPPVASDF